MDSFGSSTNSKTRSSNIASKLSLFSLPIIPNKAYEKVKESKFKSNFKSDFFLSDESSSHPKKKTNTCTKIYRKISIDNELEDLLSSYDKGKEDSYFYKELEHSTRTNRRCDTAIETCIQDGSKYHKKNSHSSGTFFNNPIDSANRLEGNKRIYSKVKDILIEKQSDEYIDIFKSKTDFLIRTAIMDKVSVKVKPFVQTSQSQRNVFNLKEQNEQFKVRNTLVNCLAEVESNLVSFGNTRFGAGQMMAISYNDKEAWIFGGVSHSARTSLFGLNLKENRFYSIVYSGFVTTGRVGASMSYLEDRLFVFGGNFEEDILRIDLKDSKVSHIVLNGVVEQRKHHVGVCLGTSLFVFGGLNKEGNVLNDCHVISLKTMELEEMKQKGKSPFISNCAYDLVYPKQQLKEATSAKVSLLDFPDCFEWQSRYKNKGIYMFGGYNEKNKITNKLYCIEFDQKTFKVIQLNPTGETPKRRVNASLNYFDDLHLVILHGGQDTHECLDDTFALDLIKMEWKKLSVASSLSMPRSGHVGIADNCRLLLLGGISNNKYVPSDFLSIDLDEGNLFKVLAKKRRKQKTAFEKTELTIDQQQKCISQMKCFANESKRFKNI